MRPCLPTCIPTVGDAPMLSLTPLLELDRESRIARLATVLPLEHDAPTAPPRLTTIHGGRRAALERLAAIDPVAYARTRNFVGGAVSRLSPWLRHGVLSLAEVRDAALLRVANPVDAEKFVSELGWRDYWRQVQAALGPRIRHDIEPPAARWRIAHQLEAMPDDVLSAQTGLACIDAFVRRLHETGWLHNHERMWLASWLVHTRGVRWQAGADWFLAHLLDGDPASNHLSWQWVAGTFSAKPYIFNRDNLERFTDGVHCRECPLLGVCPLEGTYDDLAARMFAAEPVPRDPLRIPPAPPWQLRQDNRRAGHWCGSRSTHWPSRARLFSATPQPRGCSCSTRSGSPKSGRRSSGWRSSSTAWPRSRAWRWCRRLRGKRCRS